MVATRPTVAFTGLVVSRTPPGRMARLAGLPVASRSDVAIAVPFVGVAAAGHVVGRRVGRATGTTVGTTTAPVASATVAVASLAGRRVVGRAASPGARTTAVACRAFARSARPSVDGTGLASLGRSIAAPRATCRLLPSPPSTTIGSLPAAYALPSRSPTPEGIA